MLDTYVKKKEFSTLISWTPILLLILLASGARLVGLQKGIVLDEYSTISIITQNEVVESLRGYDHPPFYFILLKLWSLLFSTEELFLRFFSTLTSWLTFVFFFFWLKRHSLQAALMGTLLLASWPIILRFSQEIRHYSLLLLLASAAFFYADKVARTPQKRAVFLLSLVLTGAILTHLIAVFLFLPIALYVIWLREQPTWKEIGRDLLYVFIPPTLFFIFLYFFFLTGVAKGSGWWIPYPTLTLIIDHLKELLGVNTLFAVLQLIPDGFPLVGVLLDRFLKVTMGILAVLLVFGNWRKSLPFLVAGLLFVLQVLLFSLTITPLFWDRMLLPALLPLVGFVAIQASTISRDRIRAAAYVAVVIMAIGFVSGWLGIHAGHTQEQWKSMSNVLSEEVTAGDFVIFYPFYVAGPVDYYAPLLNETNDSLAIHPDEIEVAKQVVSEWQGQTAATEGALFLASRRDLTFTDSRQAASQELLDFLNETFEEDKEIYHEGMLSIIKFR